MKILVTGGAGFIGSHVVDEYIRLGHRVSILDNFSSGSKKNINAKAEVIRMDIQNYTSLWKLFKRRKFDVVNHHAAQIDVRSSIRDPLNDARINILGSLNLLELSRLFSIKKFIFSASGGTVYGDCKNPAREGDPEVPVSPYGIAKLSVEKYVRAFGALYGLKYTVFRYANVYGPRQDPHGEAGVVAIFSNNLLARQPSLIFGPGKQTRDFVYVKDVARANGLALKKGHNQIINIGMGREISVNRLYADMNAIVGNRTPVRHKPARAGELNRSVVNIAKAKRVLGWAPKTSLRDGLKATLAYFSR